MDNIEYEYLYQKALKLLYNNDIDKIENHYIQVPICRDIAYSLDKLNESSFLDRAKTYNENGVIIFTFRKQTHNGKLFWQFWESNCN